MIPRIPSPSICVIDDEPDEFRTIMDALTQLGMPAVHFHGDDLDALPPEGAPLNAFRLVFTDLNLNNAGHKMALPYAVNVFNRIVSCEHGPIFLVIWSKIADEPDDMADGLSNAERFEKILFITHPEYRGKVFLKTMKKPLDLQHTDNEVEHFQKEVTALLDGWEAFDLLLRWESTIQNSALRMSENLLKLARKNLEPEETGSAEALAENLKLIFKTLVKSQVVKGSKNVKHSSLLAGVMAALVSDQLEHTSELGGLDNHDEWLGQELPESSSHQGDINSMLLLGSIHTGTRFSAGTAYAVADLEKFAKLFGAETRTLISDCFDQSKDEKKKTGYKIWKTKATAIVVELSAACDVQQGYRKSAFFVAGVMVDADQSDFCRRADAWIKLPSIMVENETDVSTTEGVEVSGRCVHFVFCARYKATIALNQGELDWLIPLFRFRDLPTASIRNWVAGQASRVGYTSL